MAESSRGRITITLGPSGQVVKRAGLVSDIDFSDSLPLSGSKRSVRDRLGRNADGSSRGSQLGNKRTRGDSGMTSLTSGGEDDVRISEGDLRFKLIQKNVDGPAWNDDNLRVTDLREKLSRIGQPSFSSYDSTRQIAESRESSIYGRTPPIRTAQNFPSRDSSRSSYSPWMLDHLKSRSPDRIFSASGGSSLQRNCEEPQRRPVDREHHDVRSPENFFGDSSGFSLRRNLQKPQNRLLDREYHDVRSPERILGASSGLTFPKNIEEPQRRPLDREYPDVRSVPYMRKDNLVVSRPVTTTTFISTSVRPSSARPMPPGPPPLSQIPPLNGVLQKAPYPCDEPQTVDGMLHSLGLGKYAIHFKAEEVDMNALRQMGENDLKELGIPMGPRKKILGVLRHSKQQR